MKKLVLIAVVLATLFTSQAASAVDATSAWNSYCSIYHFGPYPQPPTVTFADTYSGSDLATDFAAIKQLVGNSVTNMGSGIDQDDLLNASLQNWN